MEPIKKSINELDGSKLINVTADIDSITVNLPTDGIFGRTNKLNLLTTDKLSDMIDKIATHLEDITTDVPVLNEILLTMPLYQARSSMDGLIRNVINSTMPATDVIESLYYDNGGILTAVVKYANNSSVNYTRNLVNTSVIANAIAPDPPFNNVDVSSYLDILSDEPSPKLYKLSLVIGGASSLFGLNAGPSQFSYKLRHINTASISSETNEVIFSVDNPLFPGVIGNIISAPLFKYISGIPVCNSFTVQFQAINCVRAYYNKDYVARLFSNFINTVDLSISFTPVTVPPSSSHPQNGLPSSGGATNTNFTFTEVINVLSNKFVEGNNIGMNVLVQNSIGATAQTSLLVAGGKTIIIDTITDESNRVDSGVGLFPVVGTFGNPFDSNENLNSNFELVLFENFYQYIERDFSNLLIPGPDYSNLASDIDDMRWVTFAQTTTLNFIRIIITLQGENIIGVDNVFLQDMKLFVCVENKTPWFDANKSGLVPTIEGDGCLDIINSTVLEKRCIIASTTSFINGGKINVRAGIKKNSNIKLKTIIIT